MSKVRFSRLAQFDLKEIYKYGSRRWGPDQAEQYDRDLRSSATTVSLFPNLGRSYSTKNGQDFRRYNSGRHVIFYRDEDDGIFIIRLLHDRMDFDRHL